MKSIKIGDKEVEVYGSIKELPFERYRKMELFLLQDVGIGSTLEDIDKRLSNIMMFAEADKIAEVKDEVVNLRLSMFSTLASLDYKCLSFACMIKSIDGIDHEDLSSEGLNEVVKILSSVQVEELEKHWDEVKKKLMPN